MPLDTDETGRLLQEAGNGDRESWGLLLTRYEDRLRRMVTFRLDHRMQGRVATSDVIQEAFVDASNQLGEYLRDPRVPFYLWLRGFAWTRLRELHRRHLGTRMRDARREVSLHEPGPPEATSAALAAQLLGHDTGPSEAAARAELKNQLQVALEGMDPIDREILALRHFEQLTPSETAEVLGIKEKAAGMRYVRALRRLKEILTRLSGGIEEP